MRDANTILRTILINAAGVTALVPATRIFAAYPSSFETMPVIAFQEINNFTDAGDYFDNQPISETTNVQIDIYQNPNTDVIAIAQAVDLALVVDLWNRDYSGDFVDPVTGGIHKVMRYSKRLV